MHEKLNEKRNGRAKNGQNFENEVGKLRAVDFKELITCNGHYGQGPRT